MIFNEQINSEFHILDVDQDLYLSEHNATFCFTFMVEEHCHFEFIFTDSMHVIKGEEKLT